MIVFAASPKAGVSPQPTKLVVPMKTLMEEQHVRETKPLLLRNEDDVRQATNNTDNYYMPFYHNTFQIA